MVDKSYYMEVRTLLDLYIWLQSAGFEAAETARQLHQDVGEWTAGDK